MPRKTANSAPTPLPETISADLLCQLTGLSDRRHRDLAKTGLFPSPIDSVYQFAPTLRGLLKHYRTQGEDQKEIKQKIDEEKHRKLKLDSDQKEGRLTDTQKLSDQIAPMLSKFRDAVYAALEVEAPRSMAGIGVAEARIVGRRMAGALLESLQNIYKNIK